MIVRESSRMNVNSAEYEIAKKQTLDLFILTGNATACYLMFRRLVTGENVKEVSRPNASAWFRRDDNKLYIEAREVEIARHGFEKYAEIMDLDISEFKKKEDKYYDIENLSAEQLRTKNLNELEELKNSTDDDALKVNIIKQISDLMALRMKQEEANDSEKLIKFYLPYKGCSECPMRPKTVKYKEDED